MAATGKLANARKIRTSVSPEPALVFVIFIVLLRPSMSDKRSQANYQIFPFLVGRCFQRLEASQTPLVSLSPSRPASAQRRHDGARSLTLRLPGQTVDETEIRLARRQAAETAAGNSRPIRS